MELKRVTITHPKAGTARVPESAVPHWVRAGWKPAEAKPAEAEAAAPAAVQEDKAPRRRKVSEGDE